MMLKTMAFIDGSWLDLAISDLCEENERPRLYIEDVRFDPVWRAIRDHIKARLHFEVDLVRAYCLAGYPAPSTVGRNSQDRARKIERAWDKMGETPGIEMELFPYDYGGREFPKKDLKQDKAEAGPKTPRRKEKCVDVALATKMLYLAAVPGAYDVAVIITGDRDYAPVLRAVRDLGKRTMLAWIDGVNSCSAEFRDGRFWDLPPLDLSVVLQEQIGALKG
jgi:hypothetical protein